jgi:transcriptional regulator with XRE-family HTH domain
MAQLFGDKLRYLRRRDGLTQVDVAEQLGLTNQSHIANLEAGRDDASLALVVRVATLFGVATDYLLRDTLPVDAGAAAVAVRAADPDARARLFGTKLRSLRLQRNLTQVTLANQLGLARQGYISNLETGRKAPSLDLVVQIAGFFGVTTDYLLRDSIPIERKEGAGEDEPNTG